jgi:hypothetical protein
LDEGVIEAAEATSVWDLLMRAPGIMDDVSLDLGDVLAVAVGLEVTAAERLLLGVGVTVPLTVGVIAREFVAVPVAGAVALPLDVMGLTSERLALKVALPEIVAEPIGDVETELETDSLLEAPAEGLAVPTEGAGDGVIAATPHICKGAYIAAPAGKA